MKQSVDPTKCITCSTHSDFDTNSLRRRIAKTRPGAANRAVRLLIGTAMNPRIGNLKASSSAHPEHCRCGRHQGGASRLRDIDYFGSRLEVAKYLPGSQCVIVNTEFVVDTV